MKFDKRLHREFPLDLAAGTAYYDNISSDLGNQFRVAVRETLQNVVERPESFGLVRGKLRFASVRGFPYLVLFQVVDLTVFVAGLYHASSDPSQWLNRPIED
ncbi:MAG: hypothetical protein KDB27_13900 [Planctomycetales bacterium]|nr:hypothetical protein [Planctomycetales bacterium]